MSGAFPMFKALESVRAKFASKPQFDPVTAKERCLFSVITLQTQADFENLIAEINLLAEGSRVVATATASTPTDAHLWRLDILRQWQNKLIKFEAEREELRTLRAEELSNQALANPEQQRERQARIRLLEQTLNIEAANERILQAVITADMPIDLLLRTDSENTAALAETQPQNPFNECIQYSIFWRCVVYDLTGFATQFLTHIGRIHPQSNPSVAAQLVLGKIMDKTDALDNLMRVARKENMALFATMVNHCRNELFTTEINLDLFSTRNAYTLLLGKLRWYYVNCATNFVGHVGNLIGSKDCKDNIQQLIATAEQITNSVPNTPIDFDSNTVRWIGVLQHLHRFPDAGEDILRMCFAFHCDNTNCHAIFATVINHLQAMKTSSQHPLLRCQDKVAAALATNQIHISDGMLAWHEATRVTLLYFTVIKDLLLNVDRNQDVLWFSMMFCSTESRRYLVPFCPYLPLSACNFIPIIQSGNVSVLRRVLRNNPGDQVRTTYINASAGSLRYSQGVDRMQFDRYVGNPLHVIYTYMRISELLRKNDAYHRPIGLALLQLLLDRGLNPNAVDPGGYTMLNYALIYRELPLLQQLFSKGAKVNVNYRFNDPNGIPYEDGTNLVYVLSTYQSAKSDAEKEILRRMFHLLLEHGAYVFMPARGKLLAYNPGMFGMTAMEFVLGNNVTEFRDAIVARNQDARHQQDPQEEFERVTKKRINIDMLLQLIKFRVALTENAKHNAEIIMEEFVKKCKNELTTKTPDPTYTQKYFSPEFRLYFNQSDTYRVQQAIKRHKSFVQQFDELQTEHFKRLSIPPASAVSYSPTQSWQL
jgi:hypothetical protein